MATATRQSHKTVEPFRPAGAGNPLSTTISIHEVYPLPLFKRLTGLERNSIKEARRKGLKIRRVGRRAYVRGADWAEFLGTVEAGE